MAKRFTFRVLIDIEEDVFRDIEIDGSDTFLNFHKAIQQAFEFDDSQMASFYMSDETWSKGEEVTLMKMDFDDGSSSKEMADTTIETLMKNKDDKAVYVFDFMLMWCFFIDLIEVNEANKENPKTVNRFGQAPYQYGKKLEPTKEDEKLMLKNNNKKALTADDLLKDFDDLATEFGSEFEELPDDL